MKKGDIIMESKTLDSVLGATEVRRNTVDEMQVGDKNKKTEGSYGNKDVELRKGYDTISKDGDTLELSEQGKRWLKRPYVDKTSISGNKIITSSGKKISDSLLTGYSEAKLKQLYASKEITKQQYNRIIKKKSKIN